MKTIRVFVADDHEVVRDGIRYRVEKSEALEWVGEAEDGAAVFDGVAQTQPDVLVLDLNMPRFPNPVGAVRSLTKQYLSLRILILTVYEDVQLATSLLEAGARGYLVKDTLSNDLITAIQHVARGGSWLAPQVADILTHRTPLFPALNEGVDPLPLPPLTPLAVVPLTTREEEILRLIGEGALTEEIAKELQITVATVRTHMKRIYSKIGVKTRAQAALYASRFA